MTVQVARRTTMCTRNKTQVERNQAASQLTVLTLSDHERSSITMVATPSADKRIRAFDVYIILFFDVALIHSIVLCTFATSTSTCTNFLNSRHNEISMRMIITISSRVSVRLLLTGTFSCNCNNMLPTSE